MAPVIDAERIDELDIAVIGMSGRFPGARNIHEYWTKLKNGVESISSMGDAEMLLEGADPTRLRDPKYVKTASVLDDVELFDATFFDYSRREAEIIDPQCRIFLECAWESLEDAGYNPQGCNGPVGVYASASLSTYLLNNIQSRIDSRDFFLSGGNLHAVLGNANDFLATRVSYKLNLRGPSISVQTACSSSLVAIHLARQSLLNGECEMALAGGSSIYLPQLAGYLYQEGSILSSDGRCRAFDAGANGTVFGRGVGIVVLKRVTQAIADNDRIYALIKGSAVNNDGSAKVGFTAPSAEGQAQVIAEAIGNAGVDVETISYVEAHGTGTPLGDPIEIAGLTEAFRAATSRNGFCAIGSVKPNIGHLDAASGVASFIKTVLALQHRSLPPSLHFKRSNPEIDFANSPFFVNATLKDWKRGRTPRRAGVSSFGMGGTNAHVVLEEAPGVESQTADYERPLHLITLSAKSIKALHDMAEQYERSLGEATTVSLADFCFTANVGRAHFAYRVAVVAESLESMRNGLARYRSNQPSSAVLGGQVKGKDQPRIAMLFSGEGSQYVGMGRLLFETQPTFRRALQQCDVLLRPFLERSLVSILYPQSGENSLPNEAEYLQPALFSVEYALAELWRSWGIVPDIVVGHGMGEYVAACVAGAFSLEDALKMIANRARLVQGVPRNGRMAVVFADEERVASVVSRHSESASIAAVNGRANVVISGADQAIDAVLHDLEADGIKTSPLKVSHAFHSRLMKPIVDKFRSVAKEVKYSVPQIKLLSTLTGQPIEGNHICNADHWCQHLTEPVQFSAAMNVLRREGFENFLELGPSPILLEMGRSCMPDAYGTWLPSLCKDRDDWRQLLNSLGELYSRGITVDWAGFDRGYPRRRVGLPTYPFQREKYWIKAARSHDRVTTVPGSQKAGAVHPLLGLRLSSALKEIQFESQLSATAPRFLSDHRIFGTVVLPATAYVELLFAAQAQAFGTGLHSIEDVDIQQALILPEEGCRTVQLIMTPADHGVSRFNIFSRVAGDNHERASWTLHASGNVRGEKAGFDSVLSTREEVALDDVQRRCREELSGCVYYDRLQTLGLDYGSAFRGVDRLWRRDGEALGRIRPFDSLMFDEHTYQIHPGFLDACFQVVMAALPTNRTQVAYLPISFKSIRIYDSIRPSLWSHAVLHQGGETTPDALSAEVRVIDEAGRVVAKVMGIRLKRVEPETFRRAEMQRINDWLYNVEWRIQTLFGQSATTALRSSDMPNACDISLELKRMIPALRAANHLSIYNDLLPQLDALCADYVRTSFETCGWSPQQKQRISVAYLVEQLGVQQRYCRMLSRMCEMLAEDGVLRKVGSEWEVVHVSDRIDPRNRWQKLLNQFPECDAELTMLGRCGSRLAEALRGEVDPLELLFPGGSPEALEKLYRSAPFARAYNTLVQASVAKVTKHLPAGSTLRILEVGAGTGGTTSCVLPILNPNQTEYLFTDVSSLFCSKAKVKFRDYSFVRYQLLDIEHDPHSQGFDSQGFDLIVATNVLHATSDLRQTMRHVRQLLAPGGLLMIVEGIGRQRWVDLIFGLTDGWWKSADVDLRPSYPLISQNQWTTLLEDVGFSDVAAIPGEGNENDLCQQAVILARGPSVRNEVESRESTGDLLAMQGRWLIFADSCGVGQDLVQLLQARGGHCDLVFAGDAYERLQDGYQTICPGRPEDYVRLLEETLHGGQVPLGGIIHLWSVDTPSSEDLTTAQLSEAQVRGCESVLYLFQALVSSAKASCPRMYVVTRGVQPIFAHNDASPNVAHASVWGLGKVIALECPEMRCIRVDLDPSNRSDEAQMLFEEILSEAQEDQVAFRAKDRYVARLVRSAVKPGPSSESLDSATPLQLHISAQGTLKNLHFRPATRREPEAEEVQIEVRATGLNFKDILMVLGTYPGHPEPLGVECAGIIVGMGEEVEGFHLGEQVIAIGPGSFSSFVTTNANLVVRKPRSLTFEQAAAIPAAFVTAQYSLNEIAKISAKDRVLIHAAAGGVGLAAVQLAQRVGAEIFATAGSPEKREFLRKLGVPHVMDSRSLDFADHLMKITDGQGVDIVLNSLAGDIAAESLSVLRNGGRFVELGKSSALDKRAVIQTKPDASFHEVDVGAAIKENPSRFRNMLRGLVKDFCSEALKPLPTRVFSRRQTVAAFRYMAQAKHIGKIVVTQPKQKDGVHDAVSLIRSDATYLITGGLGGLGRTFAHWLVEKGARHIVLMGRSDVSDEAKQEIRQLEESGAHIVIELADVAQQEQVARVLDNIAQSMPPLRGLIHAAGALDDGVLLQLDWHRFKKVMAPKVEGTWNLHTLTQEIPLDFFVLFSSAASLLGSSGQANHVAASTFLDLLAHHRRARGLKALSINWGVWDEVGAAARGNVMHRLLMQGLGAISPSEGLQAFEQLLQRECSSDTGTAQIGVFPITWSKYARQFSLSRIPPLFSEVIREVDQQDRSSESVTDVEGTLHKLRQSPPNERKNVLIGFLRDQFVECLGLGLSQPIDHRQPFVELGLDSLIAVELRSILASKLELPRPLPATLLFDYPTLDALASYLQEHVLSLKFLSDSKDASDGLEEDSTLLAELKQLSEDDAEKLLLEELSSEQKH